MLLLESMARRRGGFSCALQVVSRKANDLHLMIVTICYPPV